MNTTMAERKLTSTQAAAIIGVTEARVSQLIAAGELKHERQTFGKSVRVFLPESDVLEFKRKRDEFLAQG